MTEAYHGAAGRAAHERVIDGEATVLARHARTKSPADRAAAAASLPAFASTAEPRAANTRPCQAPRGAPTLTRKDASTDLLTQARSLQRFARPVAAEESRGLSLFLSDTAGSIPRSGLVAGLGLLALTILVPVSGLFAGPGVAAATEANGFELADVTSAIAPRGAGAVLSVEGLLRNVSGRTGAAPALRLTLTAADGTTRLRPVSIGATRLAAGDALRFHSAVAVPAGTAGDIRVDMVAAGSTDLP